MLRNTKNACRRVRTKHAVASVESRGALRARDRRPDHSPYCIRVHASLSDLVDAHTKVAEAPADVAEPAAAEEAGEEEAVEEEAVEEEEEEEEPKPEIKLGTAPPDLRFPHTNQVSGARRAFVTIASEPVNLMPGRRLLTMNSR